MAYRETGSIAIRLESSMIDHRNFDRCKLGQQPVAADAVKQDRSRIAVQRDLGDTP